MVYDASNSLFQNVKTVKEKKCLDLDMDPGYPPPSSISGVSCPTKSYS